MMKAAIFKILGTQTIDSDSDTVELVTRGKIGRKGEELLLCYEENEASGMAGAKTYLHVRSNGTLSVKRSGAVESNLIIEKNKKNISFYPAPQGAIVLEVYGESVENELNEQGGRLTATYTLSSEGQLVSRNTIQIDVTIQEEEPLCPLS